MTAVPLVVVPSGKIIVCTQFESAALFEISAAVFDLLFLSPRSTKIN
jgi:hypothetical protein